MEINQAYVLAGGLGTRLYCDDLPKPLYPVPEEGQPIIGHILTSLLEANIERILVSVPDPKINPDWKALLCDYVTDSFGRDFSEITFVENREDKDSTILSPQHLLDDHFLLTHGDLYHDVPLRKIINEHQEKNHLTMVAAYTKGLEDFGFIDLNSNPPKFVRRGTHQETEGYVDTGIHVVSTEYLKLVERMGVEKANEETFRQGLGEIILHNGFWIDIGRPERYQEACRLAKARQ